MHLARGWAPWVLAPLFASLAAGAFVLVDLRAGYVAVAFLVLALLVTLFFRDPEREIAPGIVCAADGRIHGVQEASVATFLNVHNVHVIRAPYAGRVSQVKRFSGGHLPAFLGGAKRNAGVSITFETAWGACEVKLIAGLIARRAVAWVEDGMDVDKGQRIGIILFGSRVDVELPTGAQVVPSPGKKVHAGATTLARPPEGPA